MKLHRLHFMLFPAGFSWFLAMSAFSQEGIILEKSNQWANPRDAAALEYTDYEDHTGYWTVSLRNGSKTQVSVGNIAAKIEYPKIQSFQDIITEADIPPITTQSDRLKGYITQYPNARKFLTPRIELLAREVTLFRTGHMKYNGAWYLKEDYERRLKEDTAVEEKLARIRKEDAEKFRKQAEEQRRIRESVVQRETPESEKANERTRQELKASWEKARQELSAKIEESRQKAYAAYPDLLDPNSDLSKLVQSRIQQYKDHLPEVFNSPDWPFKEAKAADEYLRFQRMAQGSHVQREGQRGGGSLTKEQIERFRVFEADSASDMKRHPDARGAYYQDEQGNVYRNGVLLPHSTELIIQGRAQ